MPGTTVHLRTDRARPVAGATAARVWVMACGWSRPAEGTLDRDAVTCRSCLRAIDRMDRDR